MSWPKLVFPVVCHVQLSRHRVQAEDQPLPHDQLDVWRNNDDDDDDAVAVAESRSRSQESAARKLLSHALPLNE